MSLLNLGFAILVIKITICVLPFVIGIYFLAAPEEKKRDLRNSLCNKLFGVRNAIAYPSFARALLVIGAILLLFAIAATWFLILSKFFVSEEDLRSQILYFLSRYC